MTGHARRVGIALESEPAQSAAAMAARFTTDDYRARMERAAAQASDAGLDGVLVTPGVAATDDGARRLNGAPREMRIVA